MSNEDQNPSVQARAFEEIVRLGKWIVNRRKLTRQDVFSKDIEPLVDELDKVHADFLNVLRRMAAGVELALSAQERRQNFVEDEIRRQIENCHSASELLESGRIQRRKLYEKSLARYVDLRSKAPDLIAKKAFLMPADLELIAKFYDALLAYFSNDASIYAHNMRSRLRLVLEGLEMVLREGANEETRRYLEEQLEQVARMEKEFSKNWSEATKFRFALESRLS